MTTYEQAHRINAALAKVPNLDADSIKLALAEWGTANLDARYTASIFSTMTPEGMSGAVTSILRVFLRDGTEYHPGYALTLADALLARPTTEACCSGDHWCDLASSPRVGENSAKVTL